MKKILVAILSIAMACGIGFAAMGCSEKGDIAKYIPAKRVRERATRSWNLRASRR